MAVSGSFMCQLAALVLALLFALSSLSLLITTMSREEWIYYGVPASLEPDISPTSSTKASNPLENWCYYTRFRGLFYECLKDPNAAVLRNNREVRYGRCFELDFGQRNVANRGSNYWYVIILRRSQVAMLGTAVLALLAGIITLGVAFVEFCISQKLKPVFYRARVVAASIFGLSFVSVIISIVIFHAVMAAEMTKSDVGLTCIWANFKSPLQENTTFTYGGMYGLAWTAGILSLFACLCSLFSLSCSKNKSHGYKKQSDAIYAAYSSSGSDHDANPAALSGKRLPRYNSHGGVMNSAFSGAPVAHNSADMRNIYRIY